MNNFLSGIKKAQKESIFKELNTLNKKDNLEINKGIEKATIDNIKEIELYIKKEIENCEVSGMELMYYNVDNTVYKYLVELINPKGDFFYIVMNFSLGISLDKRYETYCGVGEGKKYSPYYFLYSSIKSSKIKLEQEFYKTNYTTLIHGTEDGNYSKHSLVKKISNNKVYQTDYLDDKQNEWEEPIFVKEYENIFSNYLEKIKEWTYTGIFVSKHDNNTTKYAFRNFYLTFLNYGKLTRINKERDSFFLYHYNTNNKINISCNSNFINEDLAENLYWKIFDYFYVNIYKNLLFEQMEIIRNKFSTEPEILKKIRGITPEIEEEFSETFQEARILLQKQRKLIKLTEEIQQIQKELIKYNSNKKNL